VTGVQTCALPIWWWAILGITAIIGTSLYLFLRTDKGQLTKDRLLLRLPLFGDVVQYAVIERFCRII